MAAWRLSAQKGHAELSPRGHLDGVLGLLGSVAHHDLDERTLEGRGKNLLDRLRVTHPGGLSGLPNDGRQGAQAQDGSLERPLGAPPLQARSARQRNGAVQKLAVLHWHPRCWVQWNRQSPQLQGQGYRQVPARWACIIKLQGAWHSVVVLHGQPVSNCNPSFVRLAQGAIKLNQGLFDHWLVLAFTSLHDAHARNWDSATFPLGDWLQEIAHRHHQAGPASGQQRSCCVPEAVAVGGIKSARQSSPALVTEGVEERLVMSFVLSRQFPPRQLLLDAR
mmetsp:Transcript_20043/g.43730  ORF Transcript_20043/g.43730 Transcript_20043/m.43730 type:complete len:278 (-) Transcript_20043:1253-2086(-)